MMVFVAWFETLNCLDLFNDYLILAFIVNLGVNFRTYRSILGLIFSSPQRWPRLLRLVKLHRTIFLGWPTLLMVGLAFALLLCSTLAIHFVWVQARVTGPDLCRHWTQFLAVLIMASVMVFLDYRAIFGGTFLDRPALEKDLDQAESWLHSWMAPAVRVATFGLVNPRKLVGVEVHRLLVEADWTMIGGMRRSSLRIAIQLAFGLSLWLTWALGA